MTIYQIDDEMYIILIKYFNSSIDNLKKSIVNDLRKEIFKGEIIEKIDEKILRKFRKLLNLKNKDFDKYVKYDFQYPDWKDDEKIKFQKLKETFPNDKSPFDFKKDMEVKTNHGNGIVLNDGKGEKINVKYTRDGKDIKKKN